MTNLSPGAASLLVALREPLTVVQACQAAALSGNYGRTTIAFLASKKLVAITGRQGQSHVYSITPAGEEMLRAKFDGPVLTDVHLGKQVFSTQLNASVRFATSEDPRSMKSRGDYVPPKTYIRPEAAQANSIGSRGPGC